MVSLQKSSLTAPPPPPFKSLLLNSRRVWVSDTGRKITPVWPKANSESERFKRTVYKTLRTAHLENKNWKQELFLRNYRATPTGVSPAELLFGCKMTVKLPEMVPTASSRPSFAETDLKNKEKMKTYEDTASMQCKAPSI